MCTVYEICCPNCGSPAERHYIHAHKLVQTQCPSCDYFIVTRSDTGKVVEAHAPGLSFLSRTIAPHLTTNLN
jgi:hypothetical protein